MSGNSWANTGRYIATACLCSVLAWVVSGFELSTQVSFYFKYVSVSVQTMGG